MYNSECRRIFLQREVPAVTRFSKGFPVHKGTIAENGLSLGPRTRGRDLPFTKPRLTHTVTILTTEQSGYHHSQFPDEETEAQITQTGRRTLGSATCLSRGCHRPGISAQACLIPSWVPSLALCCLRATKWGDLAGKCMPCPWSESQRKPSTTELSLIEVSETTDTPSPVLNDHPQVHREPTPW